MEEKQELLHLCLQMDLLSSKALLCLNCQFHLLLTANLPHLEKPSDSTMASQKEGPWKREFNLPVKCEEQTFGTGVLSCNSSLAVHTPTYRGGSLQ